MTVQTKILGLKMENLFMSVVGKFPSDFVLLCDCYSFSFVLTLAYLRFHRGQPVYAEGKDMPRFAGNISAIGNDVVSILQAIVYIQSISPFILFSTVIILFLCLLNKYLLFRSM